MLSYMRVQDERTHARCDVHASCMMQLNAFTALKLSSYEAGLDI